MDKKKLEYFKKKLETRQQELHRTVTRTEQDGRTADEESTQDIADKAVSSYTREFLYSLNDSERNTIQQIDQALSRIDDGTYGFCLNCGNPMSEKRLTAIPWSRHCVDCQELSEKGLLEA